jgi:hypothetical protein
MPIKAPIHGISSIVYPITLISFLKSTIFGKKFGYISPSKKYFAFERRNSRTLFFNIAVRAENPVVY